MRTLGACLIGVLLIALLSTNPASADTKKRFGVNAGQNHKSVDAEINRDGSPAGHSKSETRENSNPASNAPQRPTGTKGKPPTKAEIAAYQKAHAEERRKYAAALSVCQNELTLYGAAGMTAADCIAKVGPPPAPAPLPGKQDPKADPLPPPDPGVLAQIAVTRLRIPDPATMIGPPPEINQWKRAFVGYPLWLWNGETNQVTTAVTLDGVTLTLTARRQATRFDMGERGAAPVFCAAGTPWTRAVTPGAESPTCGYRYTQPSMTSRSPHGTYTVTATSRWEVTWTALGQTGVIPLQATATTQLPVGELQTVRRR